MTSNPINPKGTPKINFAGPVKRSETDPTQQEASGDPAEKAVVPTAIKKALTSFPMSPPARELLAKKAFGLEFNDRGTVA